MVQTRSQRAAAVATPPSPAPAALPPQEHVEPAAVTPVPTEAQEPVFPPEIFLLIMNQLAANKSLRSLLNLGLANQACAALALPTVKNYPRRTVWLAIEDNYDPFEGENGETVTGAFTKKASAQSLLQDTLEDYFLEGIFYGTAADFEVAPFEIDYGESGCSYVIKKQFLLGPLQPEGHVWVRYADSGCDHYDYELYDRNSSFDGVFTSEQEARKGIKEREPEVLYDDYEYEEMFDEWGSECGTTYRFESFKLQE